MYLRNNIRAKNEDVLLKTDSVDVILNVQKLASTIQVQPRETQAAKLVC